MTNHHQYKKPPLAEATCAIRFITSQDWDPTLPGKLFSYLQAEYPAKPKEQRLRNSKRRLKSNPEQLPINDAESVDIERLRVKFANDQGTRLITLSPEELTIHTLHPYSGWDEFKGRIVRLLDHYQQATTPSEVAQASLRYTNKIAFTATTLHLTDYFTSHAWLPVISEEFILTGFYNRAEFSYENQNIPIKMAVTFADFNTEESTDSTTTLLLDITAVWFEPRTALPYDKLSAYLDQLKGKIDLVFNSLTTQKLKEMFDAE